MKNQHVDGEASVALWKDPLWGTCKSRNNTTIDVTTHSSPRRRRQVGHTQNNHFAYPSPKRHRRYKRARRSSSIQHYTRLPLFALSTKLWMRESKNCRRKDTGEARNQKKKKVLYFCIQCLIIIIILIILYYLQQQKQQQKQITRKKRATE